MSSFPTAKLRDVCRAQNGYAFDSSRFSKTSGTPLIRIRDLKTGSPSENYDGEFDRGYLVNPGDLLIGMDGEFKPYKWSGPEALLNQRVCRLLPAREKLDADFLRYSIESLLRTIEDNTAYTTVKHLSSDDVLDLEIPLPSLSEQGRIAAILNQQMAAAGKIAEGLGHQRKSLQKHATALLRHSLAISKTKQIPLANCLRETSRGIGESWKNHPVLGATRAGLAPAKETVGKQPQRYKFVDEGTIFYNPMRILLGSIAMIDAGDTPGITSPDYVVFKCDPSVLHYRWFYYWLRSLYGENFIKGLTRGAVRERLLFKRLAAASVDVPSIEAQREVAEKLPLIQDAIIKTDSQINLAEKLPSAYLRRAFAGEL